ncbi:hypothetical protein [Phytoactinopolyspora endophytica]|uniref:hypothetical protein n=1 Tax=Phytoactinopolyspora endophytica TaxID=1642495 RepID=UPI00101D6BEC|nr:hypothetical protein [Phytoactinopolyspora endophytica]
MDTPDRTARHRSLLLTAMTALLSILAGFLIGLLVGRNATSLPEPCAGALTAGERVAAAIESDWPTASAAVDTVQTALEESDFRELAAACRDA